MAVNFQQLLTIALPPGPLAPSTSAGLSSATLQSQTSFSSALDAAITQANPTPAAPQTPVVPAATPTAVGIPLVASTATPTTPEVTLTTVAATLENALASVISAANQSALPASTLSADPGATTTPAETTTATQTPAATPNVATPPTSRAETLRFQSSAAVTLQTAPVNPGPTSSKVKATSTAIAPALEERTAPANTSTTQPTAPVLPNIVTSPADAIRVASQVQATALTPPQNGGQQIQPPIAPIGYGLDRPPVLAPTEAVAAQPVASGNRPGSTSNRLEAAQIASEQLQPPPAPVTPGFAAALANVSTAAPAPTPVPPPTVPVPKPVDGTAALPTPTTPTTVATPFEIAPASGAVAKAAVALPLPEFNFAKPDSDASTPAPTLAQPAANPNSTGTPAVDRPVSATRVETPTPAEQVGQSVISQVRVLNKGETVEYSIRLDPANLGHVQIRIVTNGENVSAHVTVANDAVRQMMESQLPELRQKLEAAGVNVPQIDVSTNAAGQQAGQGQNGNSRWQDAQQEFPFFRPSEPLLPPRARAALATAGSGSRLDVTV